jgi:hypothetical protein
MQGPQQIWKKVLGSENNEKKDAQNHIKSTCHNFVMVRCKSRTCECVTWIVGSIAPTHIT